jgi:hypothetical protein
MTLLLAHPVVFAVVVTVTVSGVLAPETGSE